MGKRQIQRSLKIFAQRAKERFKAEKVILFGSFARGKATDYSDVDVVVLSNIFTQISQNERLDLLYPLTRGLSPDFHPFGFTPSEFAHSSNLSILSEAKTAGKVINLIWPRARA